VTATTMTGRPHTSVLWLEAWIRFLVVLIAAAAAVGVYWGVYEAIPASGARVALSIGAGIIGGAAVATPYLVVLAVLALLRDIAGKS